MNWNVKDIEVFEAEKAYIDTAVIPVVPVDFGKDIRVSAAQSEFINLLTLHLERQFKGRMMMTPSFTYRMSSLTDSEISRLSQWAEELGDSGVKHIFFLTSDSGWKKAEDQLGDRLIWVPSIPLENLDEQYKHSIMEDQVKQLLNVIVQKWQKNS
ncbi:MULTISPECIES: YpiF family protein [Bacillaceae]|uniref:YpiF family protein n=1 Tax=Bacillaceae TaxID=186817 RepID=UPI001C586FD7|nr:YpiF family protein [Rossellomorea sp. YZS02]MBW3113308.1 YpiF family protein [Bacillus sp. MCCB 382]MDX8345561.1 YpiF family protein [Rossellomorea sp. YZS02]